MPLAVAVAEAVQTSASGVTKRRSWRRISFGIRSVARAGDTRVGHMGRGCRRTQAPTSCLERVPRAGWQLPEADAPPKEPPPVEAEQVGAEACALTSLESRDVVVVDERDHPPPTPTLGLFSDPRHRGRHDSLALVILSCEGVLEEGFVWGEYRKDALEIPLNRVVFMRAHEPLHVARLVALGHRDVARSDALADEVQAVHPDVRSTVGDVVRVHSEEFRKIAIPQRPNLKRNLRVRRVERLVEVTGEAVVRPLRPEASTKLVRDNT